MKIEKIIYETTRGIYSVEDKLSIGVIFIFCYQMDSKKFGELLYSKNIEAFLKKMNVEYTDYEVDFSIRLTDKNIKDCFLKTREKVIESYDSNGYYKALNEGDPYAMKIYEIVNYNFNIVSFNNKKKELAVQLSLFDEQFTEI